MTWVVKRWAKRWVLPVAIMTLMLLLLGPGAAWAQPPGQGTAGRVISLAPARITQSFPESGSYTQQVTISKAPNNLGTPDEMWVQVPGSTTWDEVPFEITGSNQFNYFVEVFLDNSVSQVPGEVKIAACSFDSDVEICTDIANSETLQVVPPLQFVTGTQLPPAVLGQPYNRQLQATGGAPPYFFLVSNEGIPFPGVTLTSDGLLTGTPTQEGTFTFSATVFDSFQNSAQRTFTVVVEPATPPPSFTTGPILPTGRVGVPYLATLEVQGGQAPLSVEVITSLLPAGLTFNPLTRVISGTPTRVQTNEFRATVTDSLGREGVRFFTIAIVEPLAISTVSPLPAATQNESFATSIAATGGVTPYSFAVTGGALPAGLSLNPTSGVISGTPTVVGSFTFTVTVTDAGQVTASRQFALTVNRAANLVSLVTTGPLPDGFVGQAYSQTFTAQNGEQPYCFDVTAGTLPQGLSLNLNTGVLSGAPTAPFDGEFTVRVRDAADPPSQDSRAFRLRILQALEITLVTLPSGVAGTPYRAQFAAQGGTPGYSFALAEGTLPGNLQLSSAGLLSGTPTEPGQSTFSVRVTDSEGRTSQRSYTLQIVPRTIPGGSVSLSAVVGAPNAQNEVDVNLTAPVEGDVTGVLTLTFAPGSNPPVDDPAVRFLNGTRTASFTIPQGQTNARFGNDDVARFQTGTVAGMIAFTASFQLAGQNVTPNPAPQASLELPTTPPAISDLQVTRSTNGATVSIRGFSTERSITTAILEFTRRPGAPGTSPVRFEVNVASAFQTWFASEASQEFGSQFRLQIPLTFNGDPQDIVSVTVRLVGPAGAGNSASLAF